MNTIVRNQSIDLIKIIAMCMVVCLHTTHAFLTDAINIEYILYNTSVVAIPLFFMVSGYLLIGRKNITYLYVKKKIYGIIRFMFIIIGLWWILGAIIKGWSFEVFFINFLGAFFQKGTFGIFWYFGAMCILYSILPLVNKLSEHKKYYIWTLIIIGVVQNLAFSFNLIGNCEQEIIQSLRIWNWLFYFMLGGTINAISIDLKFLSFVIIITGVLNICMIYTLSPFIGNTYCEYFYSCPIVILLSMALFTRCKKFNIYQSKIITSLSNLFLPVYTFHQFIISFLYKIGINNLGGVMLYVSALCASIVISAIVVQIPIIKNIFKI